MKGDVQGRPDLASPLTPRPGAIPPRRAGWAGQRDSQGRDRRYPAPTPRSPERCRLPGLAGPPPLGREQGELRELNRIGLVRELLPLHRSSPGNARSIPDAPDALPTDGAAGLQSSGSKVKAGSTPHPLPLTPTLGERASVPQRRASTTPTLRFRPFVVARPLPAAPTLRHGEVSRRQTASPSPQGRGPG